MTPPQISMCAVGARPEGSSSEAAGHQGAVWGSTIRPSDSVPGPRELSARQRAGVSCATPRPHRLLARIARDIQNLEAGIRSVGEPRAGTPLSDAAILANADLVNAKSSPSVNHVAIVIVVSSVNVAVDESSAQSTCRIRPLKCASDSGSVLHGFPSGIGRAPSSLSTRTSLDDTNPSPDRCSSGTMASR